MNALSQPNLILNGGFENYTQLPNYDAQINRAVGWNNLNEYYPDSDNPCPFPIFCATPDYLHVLGFMPLTWTGYFARNSMPFQGNGFAHFGTGGFTEDTFYEYIGCQLSEPLVIGATYNLKFQIAYGNIIDSTFCNFVGNNVGILLSNSQPYQYGSERVSRNPQYNISEIIDHSEYSEYVYQFMADSMYEYITFGNFFPREGTDSIRITDCDNFNINSMQTYSPPSYFIDDLALVRVDSTSSIHEGISWKFGSIQISNGQLFGLLKYNEGEDFDLILSNLQGRIIKSLSKLNGQTFSIELGDISSGIYLLSILYSDGKTHSLKVIIP